MDEYITSQWFQEQCAWNVEDHRCGPLTPGKIVYARYWNTKLLPLLEAATFPVVVLSNFYDNPVRGVNAELILSHRNLKRWFAVNADITHPKLTPIPMAIDKSRLSLMKHAALDVSEEVLCYCNYRLHSDDRREADERFRRAAFATVETHNKNDAQHYYHMMQRAKFVVSPHGRGVDCYRTWEALAMGAIPIVRRSFLAPLFDGMPVLQVDSWEEVTEDALEQFAPDYSRFDTLTKAYWREKINEVA